jgi:hypothetical protein
MSLWRRFVPVRRLLLLASGALLSYIVVPMVLSKYNEIRTLREARQTRAVKFGDRNDEFNGKMNELTTLMGFFHDHNFRIKPSSAEFRNAQTELYKSYHDRYLSLDSTMWWWPSDFVRETAALNLLSDDDVQQLWKDVAEYNKSILATTNQPKQLFEFIDSPNCKLDNKSRKFIEDEQNRISLEFQTEHKTRDILVQKISQRLVQSNFRTGWWDMIAVWRN